ncbi:MAG: hypothetical protein PHD18_02975 [Tolumonas sp.]|nr:hypothetical protein [Tolumonas sp.]
MAKATIDSPDKKDMESLHAFSDRISVFGLHGIPNDSYLYNEFIGEFNKVDNQEKFLNQSDYVKQLISEKELTDKSKRKFIMSLTSDISAKTFDKKKEIPGVGLSFVSDSAQSSVDLLNEYIEYVIIIQRVRLISDLRKSRDVKLQNMAIQVKLLTEDAKRSLARDIENTTLTMNIAKAAGVGKPLENYNNSDRFPITLGVNGLAEKLKILNNIKLTTYKPELEQLRVQMERLNAIDLNGVEFRPFSYIDSPDEPLERDSPKRALISVLSILLGLIAGSIFVLIRNALSKK